MITVEKRKSKTSMSENNLVIEILQSDIKNGLRNKADCCPVALALRREGHRNITVWPHRLSFVDKSTNEMRHYNATKKMTDFIVAFDKDRNVQPTVLVASRV